MREVPRTVEQRARHWDGMYRGRGPAGVSWYQPEATVSLDLIAELGVRPDAAVIDVGGGASPLAAALVGRRFSDVSVLDISADALRSSAVESVTQITADLLQWRPRRRYGLWHDRAVLHFLTGAADRRRYLDVLAAALEPGGAVIIGTFAADGPEYCSGLPVCRYSGDELARELGDGFRVSTTRSEQHTTPAGVVQPFTWLACRDAATAQQAGSECR